MKQKQSLDTLAGTSSAPEQNFKRRWGGLVLLLAFITGMALVFFLVFGNRLQPRIPVEVTRALLLESDQPAEGKAVRAEGSLLAQASGWIEPDPFPIRVPVKVDGFVEEVRVLEGDRVEVGQVLATLDSTNYRLTLDRLNARLTQAQAQRKIQEHQIELANAGLVSANADHAAAQSRSLEADDQLERMRQLEPGDVAESEWIRVEQARAQAQAALEASAAQQTRAHAVLKSREADLEKQDAEILALTAEREQARVNLDRTRVRAPISGRVLERFAAPGMKRMAGMDDADSASVVSLYDPEHLQARVDVPLSDAGRLVTGMPVRIATAALPGRPFNGRVTRITGKADITRNTLQVKVAVDKPDPALRPEMLCRVEFFSLPASGSGGELRARGIWLDDAALDGAQEGTASVWVVDPVTETVSRREILIHSQSRDGLRRIDSGLRAGEWVVAESTKPLNEGARVRIQEREQL